MIGDRLILADGSTGTALEALAPEAAAGGALPSFPWKTPLSSNPCIKPISTRAPISWRRQPSPPAPAISRISLTTIPAGRKP